MGRTQKFVKRSTFDVSSRELFDWHARPGAFERLMPPFAPVELLERSGGLAVGARTVVRVRVGGLPRRLSDDRGRQNTQRDGSEPRRLHGFLRDDPDSTGFL